MSHQSADAVLVLASGETVASITPEARVGTIYECAINGVGLMLADNPEDPESLPTTVVPNLDPPRLATTDTPFSQAVERYTFEAFHDWSAGAGQKWLNREESTSRSFLDSEGVDPFTVPGDLSLLPAVTQSLASTYGALRVVVVGDDLYAQTAANQLTRYNGTTKLWETPFTVTSPAAVVISDLTSDGQYWYAACGDRIVRGQNGDPAATWSTAAATTVKWAAGRICAGVKTGSSTVPNRFTTIAPSGTEELAGGHLTLDEGHEIVLGEAVGGIFYFGEAVGDQGQVYAWQLGVDSEGGFHVPYVAWDMPQGLVPTAVAGAAGEVWVRSWRPEGPSAGKVVLYRAIPGNGLTPFLVAELGATNREGDFREIDDNLLFSWEDSAKTSAALGAINLTTGGYCRWLLPKVAGQVRDIIEFQGVAWFVVDGQGVYAQSTTTFETTGWLTTSIVDGASSLDKLFDEIVLQCRTILSGESIKLQYTTDIGATYVDLSGGGTLSTVGAKRRVFTLGVQSGTFGIKFNLTGDGTSVTRVFAGQLKYHSLGLKDLMKRVRVKCQDYMVGLNGAPLPENRKFRGAQLLQQLELIGQTRILYQDVDYHIFGVSHVMEVMSVETRRILLYDKNIGELIVVGEADLVLRKVSFGE